MEPRDRILAVACQVFAEKGFKEATVRAICEQAGVNLAAVNYYFGDKERLYIEAVKQVHRVQGERFPIPAGLIMLPPRDRLRGFIGMLLQRILVDSGEAWPMQLMLRELQHPTTACSELVREFIRPIFETLLAILAEIVTPDTSPQRRHLMAFSIVGQCLHHRIAQPIIRELVSPDEYSQFDIATLAEHITSLTLDGVAAREQQP